jgi:hypothetical protein
LLVEENRRRSRLEGELELEHTGAFDEGRYFDVVAEYAKASPNDIGVRITLTNRGPEAAALHVLPTLWFRNTWAWGREGEEYAPRAEIRREGPGLLRAEHRDLGVFRLAVDGEPEALLFTENETNVERLYGAANPTPYVKDAFHRYVVAGERGAVNPAGRGSKAAAPSIMLARLPCRAAAAPLRRERGAGGGLRRGLRGAVRGATGRRRRLVGRAPAGCDLARGEERRAAGLRGPAQLEAVLPLRHEGMARGRSGAAGAACRAPAWAQRGLAAPPRPRPDLRLRQVGVPVVRRLGPRVPHDPFRAHRRGFHQTPAVAVPARVVHAPERADPPTSSRSWT